MVTEKKGERGHALCPIQLQEADIPLIAQLHADHRAVIERDQAGLAYLEIAHELQLPIGTVKSRLHRARHEILRLRSQSNTSNNTEAA